MGIIFAIMGIYMIVAILSPLGDFIFSLVEQYGFLNAMGGIITVICLPISIISTIKYIYWILSKYVTVGLIEIIIAVPIFITLALIFILKKLSYYGFEIKYFVLTFLSGIIVTTNIMHIISVIKNSLDVNMVLFVMSIIGTIMAIIYLHIRDFLYE